MRKILPIFAIILAAMLVGVNVTPVPTTIWAEDIDEQLEDLREEREKKQGEMQDLEERLEELHSEIGELEDNITVTQVQLNQVAFKAKQLGARIEDLSKELSTLRSDLSEKEHFRDQLVRQLYKKKRTPFWQMFLSNDGFSNLSKNVFYRSLSVSDLKDKIINLNNDISEVEEQKEQLAESKKSLDREVARIAVLKDQLAEQKEEAEVQAAQTMQRRDAISSELSELSEKISKLVRAKLEATAENTSVGDVAPIRKSLPDPSDTPAYVVYSRGYPHRVGMNQYGARGRAMAGQNYKEILKAYYKDIKIDENYDCPDKITVTGSFGSKELDFEDEYLKGIAEMPSSWEMEALKAQAVAARTYALAYTGDGAGSICTTQSCQVWLESKVDSSAASRWHQAVKETKGVAITHDGDAIKAWYASTAGGYTRLPTDFDVKWNSTPDYIKRIKDADSGGNFYDGPEYGNSPWFYKAWYSESKDGDPWLSEKEMQDLLNATLLYSEDHDLEENLYQEDPVAFDVDPGWSKDKVKDELEDRDLDPVGEIEQITVSNSSEGYTSQVLLVSENYDEGLTLSGRDFRKIFVIRSPGYLALWSSLYDIERRD
ncbi:MAG: SpoIID/LytB domain-containing protein [Patescibacteria group bacterium]|nr:SpoIID/LytB domain-containing protein [Patescibacteria group bacterium]